MLWRTLHALEDIAMQGSSSLVVAFAMAALNPAPGTSQPIDAAIVAYQNQQYVSALRLFEAAAQKGNREAQHRLGFMYREGRGTKRNDAKAMAWYRKAAEQGYAPAEYNLGLMYAQGEGAEADPSKAQ